MVINQGSGRDSEMSGGAGYTTFFRALDPRIGRWLTPDPKVQPRQSPYCSMDGNPVALVDPWGDKADGDGKTVNGGTLKETTVTAVDKGPHPKGRGLEPSTVDTGTLKPMEFNQINNAVSTSNNSFHFDTNDSNGYMFWSEFAKGSGFEGGVPDKSIDISDIDVAFSAQAGDKPSGVSDALPALMSAISSFVQEVTDFVNKLSPGSKGDDKQPSTEKVKIGSNKGNDTDKPVVEIAIDENGKGNIENANRTSNKRVYQVNGLKIEIKSDGYYRDSVVSYPDRPDTLYRVSPSQDRDTLVRYRNLYPDACFEPKD